MEPGSKIDVRKLFQPQTVDSDKESNKLSTRIDKVKERIRTIQASPDLVKPKRMIKESSVN